ncbi:MAG: ABC transporter permease [Dictyoglomi bacterium]|nr:ABC transporter permease [Dictyoglomota bacterium]
MSKNIWVSFSVIVLGVLAIYLISGVRPDIIFKSIIVSAFGSIYGITETLTKSIPLMLCGIGLSAAFKSSIWNIGAEGQLLMGAVGATWIALYVIPNAPRLILLTVMFLSGAIFGALWAFVPAILKIKFNLNEIIISLMMNYIAIEFVNYLVYGPWRSPFEWGFPYSTKFPLNAQIPRFLDTRIHYPTLLLALFLAVFVHILLKRSKLGYEIKVIGENMEAAKYAGLNISRIIVVILLLSGGLAGLAGVGEVAGIHHRLRVASGISPGYGYTAIIVAWLGKLNPLLIIPVSLLFGGLLVGGDSIQVSLGLPGATINFINGLVLIFVMAQGFSNNRIFIKKGRNRV